MACSEVPEVIDWSVFLFAKKILLKSAKNLDIFKGKSVRKGAWYNQFVEKLLTSSLQVAG